MAKQSNVVNNTETLKKQQAELLARANPALRQKIEWVRDWYKKDCRYSLVSRWELGDEIKDIVDRDTGRTTYGAHAFDAISAFSGEAAGSLRVCIKLARYYTWEQIAKISDMVMADGVTPISFSHVRVLITLKDQDQRAALLQMTLDNCWSAVQLGQYVAQMNGGRRTNNSQGRPVASPKDLSGVILQQQSFAEDFEKRNLRVWKNPETSIPGRLENMPETEYTEALAEQLAELAFRMRQLADESSARATEAEEHFRRVRMALDKRYREAPKLASEMTDEEERPAKAKKGRASSSKVALR